MRANALKRADVKSERGTALLTAGFFANIHDVVTDKKFFVFF